jgi:hypothetical protein
VLERVAQSTDAAYQVKELRLHAERKAERKRAQEDIAAILAGTNKPKTAQQAFDRWYWSLEIDMRAEVRIWLLGLDAEAYVAELDKAAELLAADRRALH